jgi:hypothetical protein
MLRGVEWWLFNGVSEQRIRPAFKRQAFQEE